MTPSFEFDGHSALLRLADGRELSLSDPEAFQLISQAWLRSGWDTKYVYGFSWLGRPIIQLPEDLIRIQEVIFNLQPDVILETGVAHGGSLIFYAGICMALGKGRVIGIDIEIRPSNRKAIEEHRLSPAITLIEGNSIDPGIIQKAKSIIGPAETALVILDSCHSKEHVMAELEAYAELVSPGSYIVACDGIMQQVCGAPRTQADWIWNNPISAIEEFLSTHPEFECHEPSRPFNEGVIEERVTYWPKAFLRRCL